MKAKSRIWFPLTVLAAAASGVLGFGRERVSPSFLFSDTQVRDTVIYPYDGYKLRRTFDLGAADIADSLLLDNYSDADPTAAGDTIPVLTARDTIKVPDSLRYTDPFRFKYYVALIDSLTHVTVRDSLRHTSDSLRASYDTLRTRFMKSHVSSDSLQAASDSLRARLDSIDWRMVDSIYLADSAATAKAEFDKWYASLSRQERKKYDMEQLLPIKLAEMDSLRKAKEEKQAVRDSIVESKPRILETFFLPDSLQYKRIVAWTVDQDFHKIDADVPDTTFNHHFNDDLPWLRKDVNVTWLGVPGAPVQYYNWFRRKSVEGVEFYKAAEPWSYNPSTLPHYNTKTPYTELAYYGTILGADAKESDNLHIFTTQNILPELNFSILYDRFGGGGFLENQDTRNKTTAFDVNYLGKKYLAHAGYIGNTLNQGENGGVRDLSMVRDTTIEVREIEVLLKDASSKTRKTTFYLDQQLRIPFNFINRIKEKRDSTYHFDADSLNRDITTAFIGHSTEYSKYYRKYSDNIPAYDKPARELYNDTFNWNDTATGDSLGVTRFDNKLFIRLQPWSDDGAVSKLDIGIGDLMMNYWDSTSVRPTVHRENSAYVYAGAEGRMFHNAVSWDAKGRYWFAGTRFSDFSLEANAKLEVYPFRRARKSPMSLEAHFETTLEEPDYYQKRMQTNHYVWDNEFGKISTTTVQGRLEIPHWNFSAGVGYALLANNIWYDTMGMARQNGTAMSIFSADLRKEFVAGPLHLDNRLLFQLSSNHEVIPLPKLAANLRWYFQFVLQRDETKTNNILVMQAGVNAFCNTGWYAPAWNPALGVFRNQNVNSYNNGPFFDVFVNCQWKRAVIFIKYQNAGQGWPMRKSDYFSADRYIVGRNGLDGLKLGIYWPFYTQPHKHTALSSGESAGSSGGNRSGAGNSSSGDTFGGSRGSGAGGSFGGGSGNGMASGGLGMPAQRR